MCVCVCVCMCVSRTVNTAVREGQREVGVAYVDSVNRRLGVAQFVDDESLGELESLLVQLGAREAVVVKVSYTHTHTHMRMQGHTHAQCHCL